MAKEYKVKAKVMCKLLDYPQYEATKIETNVKGNGYDIIFCLAYIARNASETLNVPASEILKTAMEYTMSKEESGEW